jgi:hypothetical protein
MDSYIEALTPKNIPSHKLFCLKSKQNSEGYKQKVDWIAQRLDEGMGYHQLFVKQKSGKYQSKGFIEFIPGKYNWRQIHAPDSMVIHCLWIIGKSRKMGYGKKLLDICENSTRDMGLNGITVLTSDRPFLTSGKYFEAQGYEKIDFREPYYSLYFKRIAEYGTQPSFIDVKYNFSEDLIIFDSPQCPYTKSMVYQTIRVAEQYNLSYRLIDQTTKSELKSNPIPYGTFGILIKNQHLTYYSMTEDRFIQILDQYLDGFENSGPD